VVHRGGQRRARRPADSAGQGGCGPTSDPTGALGARPSWAARDPPPGRGRLLPLARTGGGSPGPLRRGTPNRARARFDEQGPVIGTNEGCDDLEQVRGRPEDRGARSWIPRMRSAPKEPSCQPRTKTPATIRWTRRSSVGTAMTLRTTAC